MWLLLAAFLGGPPSHHHVFVSGEARAVLERALAGARQRLSNGGCEQLLVEFADREGRLLADRAAAEATPPAEILAARYFVDGDGTAQCVSDESRAAFTEPGSRVVYVCAKRFVRFASNPAVAEVLLIHELLHTLGLGENPPTSAEITRSVARRCGR